LTIFLSLFIYIL